MRIAVNTADRGLYLSVRSSGRVEYWGRYECKNYWYGGYLHDYSNMLMPHVRPGGAVFWRR